MNMNETEGRSVPDFYHKALEQALKMVECNLDRFSGGYPHVSKGGIYQPEDNTLWTSSFYVGLCYLAYDITGENIYLRNRDIYLKDFYNRIHSGDFFDHDLGFLYTLTSAADYRLTGDDSSKELSLYAADRLAERFHEKGAYIQAWGRMDEKYPNVKIIIDTMMNLPLLYYSGKEENKEIAYAHAKTAAKYLIRSDYSSYHTYLMDPETGDGVEGKTHQGYRDESIWARGQAWAVYGFALSYAYTGDVQFLTIAKKAAEVFKNYLPKDDVPYWDFTFTDEKPDVKDTSAGAVYCCGLMELCKFADKAEGEVYLALADRIMQSLYDNYRVKDIAEGKGILTEGVYHRNDGARESVIWGDYFYLEAIVRRLKKWNRFW